MAPTPKSQPSPDAEGTSRLVSSDSLLVPRQTRRAPTQGGAQLAALAKFCRQITRPHSRLNLNTDQSGRDGAGPGQGALLGLPFGAWGGRRNCGHASNSFRGFRGFLRGFTGISQPAQEGRT